MTGVLFFDGIRYLQYLEGLDDGLEIAYGRIGASTLHSDVMELARWHIGRRLMPYWSMRWLLPDPSHTLTMVAQTGRASSSLPPEKVPQKPRWSMSTGMSSPTLGQGLLTPNSRRQRRARAKLASPDVERGPAAGGTFRRWRSVGAAESFRQSWSQRHAQAEGTAADVCLRVKTCRGARCGCLLALVPNVRLSPLRARAKSASLTPTAR